MTYLLYLNAIIYIGGGDLGLPESRLILNKPDSQRR